MLDDTDYAIRARQVIEGWERVPPQGRPEDIHRMIVETIERLERIIAATPSRKDTLGTLIERYRALARRVAQ